MKKHLILMTVAATLLTSCGGSKTTTAEADKFDYTVEQFADLQILRYKVPGFEELTLKQKELIYYLTEACLLYTSELWREGIFCLTRMENII